MIINGKRVVLLLLVLLLPIIFVIVVFICVQYPSIVSEVSSVQEGNRSRGGYSSHLKVTPLIILDSNQKLAVDSQRSAIVGENVRVTVEFSSELDSVYSNMTLLQSMMESSATKVRAIATELNRVMSTQIEKMPVSFPFTELPDSFQIYSSVDELITQFSHCLSLNEGEKVTCFSKMREMLENLKLIKKSIDQIWPAMFRSR